MKHRSKTPPRKPRRHGSEALWAEFTAMIRAVPAMPPVRRKTARTGQDRARRATLERALAAKDLAAIREALPQAPHEAVNRAQRVVIFAYAANLEINAAGLSILFDRFDRRERQLIASALSAIGAGRTHADLVALQDDVASAGARRRGADISEWLQARPETRRIDRQWRAHTKEIERRLLLFCRAHADKLAAG